MSTGALDMGDISAPGSAYISALYRYSAFREDTENYGIVRGGMGTITQSLARSAEAAGRVDQDGGGGVPHPDFQRQGPSASSSPAERWSRPTSSCRTRTPKRTFLKLMEGAGLDEEFVGEVRALKTQSASAKFLCALRELPDFSGHLGSEYNPEHLAMISLCPTVDQAENSWNDARNGRIPETPIIQVQIPSVYDKTVAPEGRHVLSMWVYFLPPHVRDGSWPEMREQLGERLIDEVSRYAPNFRDAIIDWTLLTPEDIEERIGLTDGNIRHLDMVPQQMMSRRPLPGLVRLPDARRGPLPVRRRHAPPAAR